MYKLLTAVLLAVICAGFIFCSEDQLSDTGEIPDNNDKTIELPATTAELVTSDNRFGLKLFNEIVKEEGDKNIFISPLSVAFALGMTLNGAEGDTREAMETALELAGLSREQINASFAELMDILMELDPDVAFQIANSIWYRQAFTLEAEFNDLSETYFNAQITGLDFNEPGAPDLINGWVDENTNGKIKTIVDGKIDPMTVMFLINAIYFKGIWTSTFSEELTYDWRFFTPGGSSTPCRMMQQYNSFQYQDTGDFQAVDLPYGGEYFRMTVILPAEGKNINSIIAQLTHDVWKQLIDSFYEKEGTLELPKFKLEYKITLNNALSALGMGIAFVPYEADFSGLFAEGADLYISRVLHKTFVEVDEQGTEAAAVTSVEVGITSVDPNAPFYMRVDRPFIFAIRESNTGTILFIGKVIDPSGTL